jgi:protein TonB
MSVEAAHVFRSQMGGANFEFKQKYMRTFEIALLVAGLLHLFAFLAVPPIDIIPYSLDDQEMVAVDVPDDIIIPPPPEEVERPKLPTELEISDDASLDDTIPETDFNPFDPPEITEDTGRGDSFFAFDTPPKPLKTVSPEYPELARQAGAEGTVLVTVTIDETGRVIAAVVTQSDTIQSLEQAALKAARDWLFTPAKQRDQPVKARITIPFGFSLS